MKRNIVVEVFGWYGALAIVLAYILNSFGFLESKNIFYQLLNFTGAFGIVYISFKNKTYQPGVLNLIWLIIALISIINILF